MGLIKRHVSESPWEGTSCTSSLKGGDPPFDWVAPSGGSPDTKRSLGRQSCCAVCFLCSLPGDAPTLLLLSSADIGTQFLHDYNKAKDQSPVLQRQSGATEAPVCVLSSFRLLSLSTVQNTICCISLPISSL